MKMFVMFHFFVLCFFIFLGKWKIIDIGRIGASGLNEFQSTNRPQRSTLVFTLSKQSRQIKYWIPIVGWRYPSKKPSSFPHSTHCNIFFLPLPPFYFFFS